MKFGYFDDEHREYVITQPDTPLPWINYLGTEAYFGIISNTAGGYSFYKDARLRRLTRYRYNDAPLDGNGRFIYLRENTPGNTHFWSPTWQPTRTKLDSYECRHGMGYTTINSAKDGIRSKTRYFIPLGHQLEVWELTLKNERSTPVDLSVFSAIEFCLWDAYDDMTNFQRNYSIGEVEVDNGVIYHRSEYRERRDHFAYFACSEPLAGFDTQREDFLAQYHGWDSPKVVEEGTSHNSLAMGWQPIGSHHVRLNLKPGEEKKVIFVLGYHENPKSEKFDKIDPLKINKTTVLPIITAALKPEFVTKEFEKLAAYWNDLLSKLHVSTPDQDTDRMVNIWTAYQMMVTFNFSRSASYFESGVGRGMGFRDSNQDLLGFTHLIPERARERLIDLAATQLPNGGAYHQYQPMTKLGNNDVGSNFNDDPLWLVMAVSAYIKETGDLDLLNAMVPYDSKPGTEKPIHDHLRRSIQYTLDRLGPHKLPLIGRADWNDCLNLNIFSDTPGQPFQTAGASEGKIAESVFIAGLFVLACQEMADLSSYLNLNEEADQYLNSLNEMEQTINQYGWDGKWFRRAYDHFGNPVGSVECQEGQIFVEPQGMCVMAGVGLKDGKAIQAMDSLNDRLAFQHGVVVHQPAYTKYYIHLGEISSYPPGYKENASVFCHTNPWVMIAEARLGRGDRAFDYYKRINPSARESIGEVHRCEPYVYAQMIAGKDAVKPGEAKNSWLTGTAAWNYVAITQWILGVRPTFDGLMVSPVIPSDWQHFDLVRYFRGVKYNIHVERIGSGNNTTLFVDDRPLPSQVIPFPSAGTKEIHVVAKIGGQ